jgi:SAM-dependent methyltransferase
MNWRRKARVLSVLGAIPFGSVFYHAGQRWLGTNRLDAGESVRRALDLVAMLREASRDPAGCDYLEIGTGWRPFVPVVLYLAGARRGITVDVNRWMTAAYARETCLAAGGHLEVIAAQLGIPLDLVARRYRELSRHLDAIPALRFGGTRALAGIMRALEVEYRCPFDAGDTGLPPARLDFVLSSNVLEHVPPQTLAKIHRESWRVLKPGGLLAHRFNPQDHASHVDVRVTGANFVQFSDAEWRRCDGGRLGYHNRLRCVEHREMLERAGYRILVDRRRADARALAEIESGRLRVDPRFARFTPRELTEEYMWVVAERPTGSPSEYSVDGLLAKLRLEPSSSRVTAHAADLRQ